jgi:ABC-type multidrug transport system ATPase subunit/ABC-type multidrug transport system permease subunit
MTIRLRIIAPDGGSSEREVADGTLRLGRDPACEVALDASVFPMVSGQHARLAPTASGWAVTSLSATNKTLLNDKPVSGSVPVRAGDRIRLGFSGPTVELVALGKAAAVAPAAAAPSPAPNGDSGATAQAGPQHLALPRGSARAATMVVGKGGVIGRTQGQAEFVLDHPHISRRHALLYLEGGKVCLRDLGSANGTFVNGRRLSGPVMLAGGEKIDIGPFALEFTGDALVSRSRANNIELVSHRLRRVVKDRATGQPLTLLDDINLVIRPREFVCLLGPSGSGKTTLLAMLSGRNPPDQGSIRVNGRDLYENFAALKQDIAVVPQKDVLHDSLVVGTALGYTAELRLPPDTDPDEITGSVSDILEVVGLTKRRGTLIRHLSGGQIKRASLANELMARPSLLFLDEVTSGLDEQTDRDMMELFRQVADGGKTVVCITHSLANVEATCHLVVILTEGGRLAFVGTPDEARTYFAIARLGDVYRKLAERKPEEWQTAFKASPFYARYVRDRLPDQPGEDDAAGASAAPERTPVNPVRQALILTRRYLAIWRGDPLALLAMLGQAVLVALLLGVLFGRLDANQPNLAVNLLFLLNVSCFWFGCNNAAKEIVKERIIFARERDFNLRLDSYFASKSVVLALIALVQVAILFGITRAWCEPAGSAVGQGLVLAVLALAGTALGLLISAVARTEEVAVALVPIAVVPQIILAGVIAPLSGLAQGLARGLITAHWAEQALEALLPDRDLKLLGLSPAAYGASFLGVLGHLVLFGAATVLLLWLQDRSKRKG